MEFDLWFGPDYARKPTVTIFTPEVTFTCEMVRADDVWTG
jgi:hypothetical protein